MRLLLISNSTMPGEPYLTYPLPAIAGFLGEKPKNILFFPFAAVTFSFDTYEAKVRERMESLGHRLISIHHFNDPGRAIMEADVLMVGGGNTWQLVRMFHDQSLFPLMRQAIERGIPYIGWSAGSNVACPTLRTTNDMPIIDPLGFDCMGLVPFQINPHYLDHNPEGHGGETREQRIEEFLAINPGIHVVGLREGTMLRLEGKTLSLIGERTLRIFRQGSLPMELTAADDLSFLLEAKD
ncbi:MAG: dipeptidase PepE [Marinilabiliales bacterium]|nr:dipeptidase PepE [Marinilabiliales bacterium]